MNIRDYILKNGVKSKETANHLIKEGLVLLNGCAITNPDIPVGSTDDVKILDKNTDVPGSFWELKKIQDSGNVIKKGDFILDIGSEDGGFPIFAKELKTEITVLSIEKLDFLEKKDIKFKECNVMLINPDDVLDTKYDLIINELKLDLIKSFQIFEKFLNFLSPRGRILFFLSGRDRNEDDIKDMAEKILNKHKFDVIDFYETKKGFYVYAKKAYVYMENIF